MNLVTTVFKRADLIDAGWDIEHLEGDTCVIEKVVAPATVSTLFVVRSRGPFIEFLWADEYLHEFPASLRDIPTVH